MSYNKMNLNVQILAIEKTVNLMQDSLKLIPSTNPKRRDDAQGRIEFYSAILESLKELQVLKQSSLEMSETLPEKLNMRKELMSELNNTKKEE